MLTQPASPLRNPQMWILFACFFLNFLAFGLVIPMAPEMVDYYLEENAGRLLVLEGWITQVRESGGAGLNLPVLFGGFLATLFALAQYFAAPMWGKLSDRLGRKPVLLWSSSALVLAQALWVFSGSLELFLVSRFFTGLTSGNIAVVSAAIADLTDRNDRLTGMNVLAIGFGMGWTLAPVAGGLCVQVNPLAHFPELSAWGVTPFSFAAATSCLLALINVILVALCYRESHPVSPTPPAPANAAPSVRPKHQRLRLWHRLPEPEYNRLNIVFLCFVFSYAGTNFNVGFLAFERFEVGGGVIGTIYMVGGLGQMTTQSIILPKLALLIGHTACALCGATVAFGAIIAIAFAHNLFLLGGGVAILSIGAGLVFPSLSALSSLLAPADKQGEYMGVFRAMASAGSAGGPLTMGLLFGLLGGATGFCLFATIQLLVFALAKSLPNLRQA